MLVNNELMMVNYGLIPGNFRKGNQQKQLRVEIRLGPICIKQKEVGPKVGILHKRVGQNTAFQVLPAEDLEGWIRAP